MTLELSSAIKYFRIDFSIFTLTLKLVGGGFVNPPNSFFFGINFLPLDHLPNTFAQLFLDNEDIFWH